MTGADRRDRHQHEGKQQPQDHFGVELADAAEDLGVLTVVQKIRNDRGRFDGHLDEGEHDHDAQGIR
jgi:hypothetical protein